MRAQRSLHVIKRAVTLLARDPLNWSNLGCLLIANGDHADALEALRNAEQFDPIFAAASVSTKDSLSAAAFEEAGR